MIRDAPEPRVFVSFRNGDEPFAAALIYRALAERFGPHVPFRSSESILPGSRWAEAIWASLHSSLVLVAVIGPRWLDIEDEHGERRLLQDGDWVRGEIACALASGKTVVPVLLDGVRRPTAADLPPDLKELPALQSLRMSHRRIEQTISVLFDVVGLALDAEAARTRGRGGYPTPKEVHQLDAYAVRRRDQCRSARQSREQALRSR